MFATLSKSDAINRLTSIALLGLVLALLDFPACAQTPDAADVPIRALVVARDRAVISSEIAARIDAITARPGDTFVKGDVLVRLDCALYEAERASARADRASAAAQLESNQKLYDLRSIGKLDLAVAQAVLDKADAALRRSQVMASRCTILAPFDGRVAAWHAQPFEVVDPGVPLIEIVGIDPLEVEAIVPSAWLPRLEIGAAVEISLEETGQRYTAAVTRIGSGVDPASRTLRVFARFDKPDAQLRPGMSGQARFGLKAAAQ